MKGKAVALTGAGRAKPNAERRTVEGASPKRITYTITGYFDETVGLGDALEVLRELHDKAIELGAVETFVAEVNGGKLDVKDFA